MAQNEQQLKQKYQPAIDLIQQCKVHLQNINMQGDKLFIRGEAPSQDVKNEVWNEIKRIDPNYSDLICDLTVVEQPQQKQPQSAPTMAAGASASGGQAQRQYTVQAGDTLSKISKHFFGDASQYMRIFEANRHVLEDPNKIQPGQELVIPE